ncbi:hypothetical protein [Sphingomonas sp. RS2018]
MNNVAPFEPRCGRVGCHRLKAAMGSSTNSIHGTIPRPDVSRSSVPGSIMASGVAVGFAADATRFRYFDGSRGTCSVSYGAAAGRWIGATGERRRRPLHRGTLQRPTEAFNHFAQDATFNRGRYRSLEDEWARDKRAGRTVAV